MYTNGFTISAGGTEWIFEERAMLTYRYRMQKCEIIMYKVNSLYLVSRVNILITLFQNNSYGSKIILSVMSAINYNTPSILFNWNSIDYREFPQAKY